MNCSTPIQNTEKLTGIDPFDTDKQRNTADEHRRVRWAAIAPSTWRAPRHICRISIDRGPRRRFGQLARRGSPARSAIIQMTDIGLFKRLGLGVLMLVSARAPRASHFLRGARSPAQKISSRPEYQHDKCTASWPPPPIHTIE
jgi:hypothetical protein